MAGGEIAEVSQNGSTLWPPADTLCGSVTVDCISFLSSPNTEASYYPKIITDREAQQNRDTRHYVGNFTRYLLVSSECHGYTHTLAARTIHYVRLSKFLSYVQQIFGMDK